MDTGTTVLGIVGSYREDGYCAQLAALALGLGEERGAKIDRLRLAEFEIGFCTNCRVCTQAPGTRQVPCVVHHDDMQPLLDRVAAADVLVIAAPVNNGGLNALTQRFVERCVGFYYWPWTRRGGPVLRNAAPSKRALVISTSAAPRLLNNRLFGNGAGHALGRLARTLGAGTVETVKIGMLTGPEAKLAASAERRVKRAVSRLLEG